MKISKQQVEHVAHLARLSLDDDELNKMTGQLDKILSYVEKLEELDTNGVVATSHVFSICNAFRDDIVKESLSQNEALMNASGKNNEMFQVPRII